MKRPPQQHTLSHSHSHSLGRRIHRYISTSPLLTLYYTALLKRHKSVHLLSYEKEMPHHVTKFSLDQHLQFRMLLLIMNQVFIDVENLQNAKRRSFNKIKITLSELNQNSLNISESRSVLSCFCSAYGSYWFTSVSFVFLSFYNV